MEEQFKRLLHIINMNQRMEKNNEKMNEILNQVTDAISEEKDERKIDKIMELMLNTCETALRMYQSALDSVIKIQKGEE